jgi:hypothetical protein
MGGACRGDATSSMPMVSGVFGIATSANRLAVSASVILAVMFGLICLLPVVAMLTRTLTLWLVEWTDWCISEFQMPSGSRKRCDPPFFDSDSFAVTRRGLCSR